MYFVSSSLAIDDGLNLYVIRPIMLFNEKKMGKRKKLLLCIVVWDFALVVARNVYFALLKCALHHLHMHNTREYFQRYICDISFSCLYNFTLFNKKKQKTVRKFNLRFSHGFGASTERLTHNPIQLNWLAMKHICNMCSLWLNGRLANAQYESGCESFRRVFAQWKLQFRLSIFIG